MEQELRGAQEGGLEGMVERCKACSPWSGVAFVSRVGGGCHKGHYHLLPAARAGSND
jgi:hypothetical protein